MIMNKFDYTRNSIIFLVSLNTKKNETFFSMSVNLPSPTFIQKITVFCFSYCRTKEKQTK